MLMDILNSLRKMLFTYLINQKLFFHRGLMRHRRALGKISLFHCFIVVSKGRCMPLAERGFQSEGLRGNVYPPFSLIRKPLLASSVEQTSMEVLLESGPLPQVSMGVLTRTSW